MIQVGIERYFIDVESRMLIQRVSGETFNVMKVDGIGTWNWYCC